MLPAQQRRRLHRKLPIRNHGLRSVHLVASVGRRSDGGGEESNILAKVQAWGVELPPGTGARACIISGHPQTRVWPCEGLRAVAFAEAKSSDQNHMRSFCTLCCTGLGCRYCWPTKESSKENVATHLSNTPSVSPTLPGPNSAPQCSIEMKPVSQGMRMSNSTNCAAQLHSFMLTIGRRLDACRRAEA